MVNYSNSSKWRPDLLPPNPIDIPFVDQLFAILQEPKRRNLLFLLEKRSLTADEITAYMQISPPAVEKHLKQLMENGLITRKVETIPNLHYTYTLTKHCFALILGFMDVIQNFISNLKVEYQTQLELEEQALILGTSTQEKYFAVKKIAEELWNG